MDRLHPEIIQNAIAITIITTIIVGIVRSSSGSSLGVGGVGGSSVAARAISVTRALSSHPYIEGVEDIYLLAGRGGSIGIAQVR